MTSQADSYHTLRALVNRKILGSVVDIQDETELTTLKRSVGSYIAAKNLLDYETHLDSMTDILVRVIRARRTINLFSIMAQFQADFLMKAGFSRVTRFLEDDTSPEAFSSGPRLIHWCKWQSMPWLENLLFKSPISFAWWRKTQLNSLSWTSMSKDEFETRAQRRNMEKNGTSAGFQDIDRRDADLCDKFMFGDDRARADVSDELILKMISSTIAAVSLCKVTVGPEATPQDILLRALTYAQGFDTTSYFMTMILYLLLKNPHTMRKLRTKLTEVGETGRLSDPIKFIEVDKLEYLDAVIKEAMRFKSFFRPSFERVVPQSGVEIAGKYVPGGTVVYISQVNTSFDRSVWGRYPDGFRPERWLGTDQATKSMMERCMLGFGGGKRICLGRHIAKFEMKKVIPRLLLEFDVSHHGA
jgi:hypothetical protein